MGHYLKHGRKGEEDKQKFDEIYDSYSEKDETDNESENTLNEPEYLDEIKE